jgi:uroporphyrin-III C-methyltransferase/precorrin-2 dehydrogenase/sirohydrochlorin ferrochelatase
MLHSLPLFHRISGQPVIVLGEGEAAEAKRRLVERAGGVIVGEADRHARLAFVATPDPEATAARLKARGVLVNVVDRPELCDFTVPSVLDRDPVLIAVGTGGASAGLAKALRLRLETLIPAGVGDIAKALHSAREGFKARFPDAGDRRRALDGALAEGGLLDPFRSEGAQDVLAILTDADPGRDGTIEFTVHSDDPDDLTLGQARALGSADFVAFEPGVSPAILHRARADAAQRKVARGAPAPSQPGFGIVIRRG